MLNRIFPPQFDNDYRGRKLALWFFALIVLLKVGISLSAMFDGYNMARAADGIPIDTFTSGGAEAVVSVTTLLGLSQFLLAALGVLASIRYRDDSAHVCPFLGGISCQKMDSSGETHRQGRDVTQHLRKSGAHRIADRGSCFVPTS